MEAVLAFGLNNQGQLGLHQDERNESTPVLVREFNQTGRSVVHISASLVHSVLLDSSGVVYTCGGNDRNQLGRDRRKRIHGRRPDQQRVDPHQVRAVPALSLQGGTGRR